MSATRTLAGDLAGCLDQAGQKRREKLTTSGLKPKAGELLELLKKDPWATSSPFEKLVGDLAGAYSRRINVQHRLVYQVLKEEKTVKVLRMWTHHE